MERTSFQYIENLGNINDPLVQCDNKFFRTAFVEVCTSGHAFHPIEAIKLGTL